MRSKSPLARPAPAEQEAVMLPDHMTLEWSVCPGATESANMTEVPHGTVITAVSFTSVSLMNCDLAGEQQVQYEVHLLTGGLLQCGWCATPLGLPFTATEGVGDFPLSIAADGSRGVVWHLTSTAVPMLCWRAGDVLGCFADLATGNFDFAINGELFAGGTLPTKASLLRRGVRSYTDAQFTDEMLVFTPALSLGEGEACLVNLGEAQMCYPRSGYRTVCETFWCGVQDWTTGDLPTPPRDSGDSDETEGSEPQSYSANSDDDDDALREAVSASAKWKSNAGEWLCLSVGGVSVRELIDLLQLPLPENTTHIGNYMFHRLFVAHVVEMDRAQQRCVQLVCWLEGNVQKRWKAFHVWVGFWLLRFYVPISESRVVETREGVVVWDGVLTDKGDLTPEALQCVELIWNALSLFMPSDSFAPLPAIMITGIQHRMSNTVSRQLLATRMMRDFASFPSYRRVLVADTPTFVSALLNLFIVHPINDHITQAITDALHSATPADAVVQLALRDDVFAQQRALWREAATAVQYFVDDPECRGPLAVALMQMVQDPRLRAVGVRGCPGLEDPSETFHEGYPYAIAAGFSPVSLCAIALAVAAALGRSMPPVDEQPQDQQREAGPSGGTADSPAPTAWRPATMLATQLSWRAVAMEWLPPQRFYGRPLSLPVGGSSGSGNGGGGGVEPLMNDRIGGSLTRVGGDIAAELAKMRGRDATFVGAPGETPFSAAASTRPEHWREVTAHHVARRGTFDSLPADAVFVEGTEVPPATAPGSVEDAVQERRDELFLAAVLLLDVFLRGLLAQCAALPSALCTAAAQHMQAPEPRTADVRPRLLQHISSLAVAVTPLRDGQNNAGLRAFCGVLGRVHGYYWGRMAAFEQCLCATATPFAKPAASPPSPEALRRREAAEAVHAPPRAFLMLPVEVSNVFVHLWLLLGLVRGQNADLATRAPTLFCFFFDVKRRRATANAFARLYVHHAAASVLGGNAEDRCLTARQLSRLHKGAPREAAGRLSFLEQHFRDFLDTYQRYPNDRAAVNFMFALTMDDGCMVPPPRMLDESFAWLIPKAAAPAADTPRATFLLEVPETVDSADFVYYRLFDSVTEEYEYEVLQFPITGECNGLLSRLSQRLPPPPCWTAESTERIRSFRSVYEQLRKNLYVFESVSRINGNRKVRWMARRNAPAWRLNSDPALAAAAQEAARLESLGRDHHDDHDALRKEMLEMVVQCFMRVSGPQASRPSPGLTDVAADNVLMPAVVQDSRGKVHWSETCCTRVGVVTSVIAATRRMIDINGTVRTSNPFLTIGALLIVPLVSLTQAVIDRHPWWTPLDAADASSGLSAGQRAGSVRWARQPVDAIPADIPANMDYLRGKLEAMRAAAQSSAAASPQHTLTAAAPSVPSGSAETSSHVSSREISSTRPVRRPSAKGTFVPASNGATAADCACASAAGPATAPPATTAAHAVQRADGSEDDDDSDRLCMICMECEANVRLHPCQHVCCHICYRRYQRSVRALQLVREGVKSRATPTCQLLQPPPQDGAATDPAAPALPLSPLVLAGSDTDVASAEAEGVVRLYTLDTEAPPPVQTHRTADAVTVPCFFCKEDVTVMERITDDDYPHSE